MYRTGAGAGDRHLIDANNGGNYLIRWNSAGNLQFFINGSLIISYAFPFTLNQWYHIAAVRSGSTTCTLYVNGVSVGTGSSSANVAANNTLFIGGQPAANDWFQGYMSSVRIVKGTAVYTAAFTPSTTPLTAISGTSLLLNYTNAGMYDAATINNLLDVGDTKVSTTESKFAPTSVFFDGTGDYLQGPTSISNFGTGDFTMEMWFYKTSTGEILVSNVPSGADNNYFVLSATPAQLTIQIRDGSGQQFAYGPSFSNNTWVHAAVTRSSGSVRVFVNGVSGSPVTITKSITARELCIGAFLYTGIPLYYTGYIQDVRITKGVARYTANFTPPAAPFPTN
jgi:hypothetical protein